MLANSTTAAFQTSTFDPETRTFSISVETSSEDDVGYYLNQIEVVLVNYDFTRVLEDWFFVNVLEASPCTSSKLNDLILASYEYYVWQPELVNIINVTDNCPDCNC